MKRQAWMYVALANASLAMAHQPTLSDGSAGSAGNAIAFDDIQLSRVVYHEVTEDAPAIWLTFEIDEPQALRVTLGVPFIDRLAAYRPAFAMLGPGLPELELPIEHPEGLGGLLFTTDEVSEPEVFNEPFSGTTSWILREEDVDLPEAGQYYLVAFDPSGANGKLWLAPGVREEFSLADFVTLGGILEEVRAFHEFTPGSAPCFLLPGGALAMVVTMLWLARRRSAGE